MKRILSFLIFISLAMGASAAGAQTVVMDEGHVAFDYPDSWLVVSPQLCGVYAPLLADAGLDADDVAKELTDTRTLSRAYNADYTQYLAVLIREDELSQEIYEIDAMTDAQKTTLRRRAESNSLWETTGLRAQDVEWQKENGENWLYIHYIVTRSGTTVGRGLRYVTVHNGLYVELDWRIESGRFSGRDLNAFRARLADIAITESVAEPVRDVKLDAEIPTETSVGQVTISGTATAGATVIAETPDGNGAMLALDAETASSSGQFTLALELEKEGSYEITLTASKEGMNDASLSGAIAYSAKTLPVSGIAESQTVTSDKVTITGTTLAGVQLQLVTPFGVSKKKSGNDGTFSFELTTDTAGDYNYTLILDKSGYNQRRVAFAITRVTTDEQEKDKIRQSAVKLSYKELQQDKAENRGKVMQLYGPVSEISSSGSIYYVRLQYNKNAKGKWYNDVVIICDADTGAKVGDMMTAVVTVDGVYDEQDASGNDVAVPRFNLLFVDKIE